MSLQIFINVFVSSQNFCQSHHTTFGLFSWISDPFYLTMVTSFKNWAILVYMSAFKSPSVFDFKTSNLSDFSFVNVLLCTQYMLKIQLQLSRVHSWREVVIEPKWQIKKRYRECPLCCPRYANESFTFLPQIHGQWTGVSLKQRRESSAGESMQAV